MKLIKTVLTLSFTFSSFVSMFFILFLLLLFVDDDGGITNNFVDFFGFLIVAMIPFSSTVILFRKIISILHINERKPFVIETFVTYMLFTIFLSSFENSPSNQILQVVLYLIITVGTILYSLFWMRKSQKNSGSIGIERLPILIGIVCLFLCVTIAGTVYEQYRINQPTIFY